MISGIYIIQNLFNHKVYVGSAINLRYRRIRHFADLDRNGHKNQHLQNAWNKYGREKFIFWVVEKTDINLLIEREQFYLDMFKSYSFGLYNKCFVAGNTYGIRFKLSEEAKQKIRDSRKNNPKIFGYKHTEESRQKMRAAAKGKPKPWKRSKRLMVEV